MRREIGVTLVFALAVSWGASAELRAAWREEFEGPEVAWKLADADTSARITYQRRSFEQYHSGHASEQIQIAAGRGTYVRLALPIDPARVIGELQPSLWVKADRPGVQLMMRVVFPRTQHPRTGEPLSALLFGESYSQVGTWQRLAVKDVEREVQHRQRALATQFKNVDRREAYVDLVVLNAYGGQGLTTLWIDELSIEGHVPRDAVSAAPTGELVRPVSSPRGPLLTGSSAADTLPYGDASGESGAALSSSGRAIQGDIAGPSPDYGETRGEFALSQRGGASVAVERQGSVLLVGGRPFMARVVDYNDEPLSYLAELGFNVIKLRRTPSAAILAEAEESALWLVAPPPAIEPGQRIGDGFARVLAWSLGERLGPRDVANTREIADKLRLADPQLRRPVVAAPVGDWWAYSHLADVLIAEQSPVGSSFPLREYQPWLVRQRRLMRSETPMWATVQTDFPIELHDQIKTLMPRRETELAVEPAQMQLMAYAAVSAGARGVYFRSHSPLNAPGKSADRRSRAIRRINAELALLDPWCAAGQAGGTVDTGDPNVQIATLTTDRSQMLLVTRIADDQQYVPSVPASGPIHFTMPGASGVGDIFHVTANGLWPLAHRRGAGGLRVSLEGAGLASLVLVARDPLVLNHVARQVRSASPELPLWRLEEATEHFAQVQASAARGEAAGALQAKGRTIETYLREAERVLETGDAQAADRFLTQAESALAQVRRAAWDEAAAIFPQPAASPLCAAYDLLPLHWELGERLRGAEWTGNLLAGGDFEDMNHTLTSGWKQHRREIDGVGGSVEFSLESPQSGRSCLRMMTWPTEPSAPPAALDAAPLWIKSAPVQVEQGQLVRIHGWIKIPQPIAASPDGLTVFDSFGGQPLAIRQRQTSGWREFLMYRAATRSGDLEITFALTGLGEVWLDGVSVATLPPYATVQ